MFKDSLGNAQMGANDRGHMDSSFLCSADDKFILDSVEGQTE